MIEALSSTSSLLAERRLVFTAEDWVNLASSTLSATAAVAVDADGDNGGGSDSGAPVNCSAPSL